MTAESHPLVLLIGDAEFLELTRVGDLQMRIHCAHGPEWVGRAAAVPGTDD